MLNLTLQTLGENISNLTGMINTPKELSNCLAGKMYSIECLYETICPQLNQHFINAGIWILIINIFFSWLMWWFVNWGYRKINFPVTKKWGSMEIDFNRLLFDSWIRARLTSLNIAYIAMVIWLSINQKI